METQGVQLCMLMIRQDSIMSFYLVQMNFEID